jgi:hypothetical protein
MAALPPDEATGLLRQRLAALTEGIEADQANLTGVARDVPRLFLVENEYDLAIRRAEATWIAALLDELERGTFPGLDGWRAFHETGRLPDDIAALVEKESKN